MRTSTVGYLLGRTIAKIGMLLRPACGEDIGTVAQLAAPSVLSHGQRPADGGVGAMALLHVGVPVSDLKRALHFYVDQLGLREAFRAEVKQGEGNLMLVYLQVGHSGSFVELFPGKRNADSPSNPYSHVGIRVSDLRSSLRSLKTAGYLVSDIAFEQADKMAPDGTYLSFVNDPDGNYIELSQIGAESLQAVAAPALMSAVNPHD